MPFLREIGHALRTNVRLKMDENNRPMVFPWRNTDGESIMRHFRGIG